MKTNHLLPIAALGLLGLASSAFAQTGTVTNASAPVAAESAAAPAPNQIVYKSQLPTPQELTNAAASRGLTVEQIDQISGRITAVYKTANGQTSTVAYALLPNAGGVGPSEVVAMAPSGTNSTVVYTGAPDAYYYDPLYSPWYYGYGYPYGGVALGIGFGGGYYYRGHYYRGGHPGGGYHGGGWGHPGGGHGGGYGHH